jgi:hypothetical protein
MNTVNKIIETELEAADLMSAAMAEGAIDLPQGVACQRVISCDGRMAQLSCESVKGALALEGIVEFTVVFESAEGLDSVTGVCPFTHRLGAPQAEPGMDVKVHGMVSSPSARTAGSARLLVEAVVELDAQIAGRQPVNVVVDGEDSRLQMLMGTLYWQRRAVSAKASVTVREEFEVPKDLPEVAKVLLVQADVRVGETQALRDEAMVSGDLLLNVVYADKTGGISKGSFAVPFGMPVDAAGITDKMEARAWGSASQLFINVGENMGDERRVLSLEAPLFLSVEGYEPCEMEALQDAYHLDSDMVISREDIGLYDGPVETVEKVLVRGALPRTDFPQENVSILASVVTPVIDGYSVSDGQVDFNGRLRTRLFCRSADDTVVSVLSEAPVNGSVLWQGASADSKLELSAVASKCNVFAGAGFDVEAELRVTICSRRMVPHSVVTELAEGVRLSRALPPLTLCIAGEHDTAWSLARRCRVKVEDLIKANPEIAKGVAPGAKIVVFRK